MLWLMRTRRPGPGAWSQWERGHRDIPADALVDFQQERIKRAKRVAEEMAATNAREHETTLHQIYGILERISMAVDQSRQGRLRPRGALQVAGGAGDDPPSGPTSAAR